MPNPACSAPEIVAPYADKTRARAVKLLRNGANEAVRIPKEFELPGVDALIHREGDRLIIEPAKRKFEKSTVAALAQALRDMAAEGPIDEKFPDVDEDLWTLDGIALGPLP